MFKVDRSVLDTPERKLYYDHVETCPRCTNVFNLCPKGIALINEATRYEKTQLYKGLL